MKNKTGINIQILIIVILVLGAAQFFLHDRKSVTSTIRPNSPQPSTQHSYTQPIQHSPQSDTTIQNQTAEDDLKKIATAFEQQQSDVQVMGAGRVKAILKDDLQGLRHQKFILQLANGQTVLIAHNIDLSPRIENLHKGDTVQFYGEYEYSAQGGVIHWTHHDPQKRHLDGWLKHQGQTYQ